MKSYIITRFSIYDYTYKCFELSIHHLNNAYREKLFCEKRLSYKFNVFKKVTLPSVLNQTNQNFEWYIYTSPHLPNKYKKKLLNLIEPYPKIKCCFVSCLKDFFEFKELPHLDYDKEPYCTVRLDDDDGLNKNFLKIVEENHKFKKNTIISFPRGTKFTYKNNNIIYGKNIHKKNNAFGLTGIGINIYHCGNHADIFLNEKYEIIYDETPYAFLCCSGEWCDSHREID